MNDQEKTKQQLVEELAELRQNLDALVNYLPEGFFIVDAPDVKIRLASRDSQQTLGVSWGELEGVHDTEHFDYYKVFRPDGSTVEVKQLPLARALSAGEVIRNEEWLFQTTDGRRVPILCHAGPVRDQQGAIRGAVISWQDISDRKQAEQALKKAHDELEERVKERTAELQEANERLQQEVEERRRAETALRQSEDRYKMLVETSPDAVLMVNLERNITYASQRSTEVFGYDTVDELCGPGVTSLVAEEERHRLNANISLLSQQGVRRQIEYIGLRRDGSRFLAEVSSAVLLDDRGEPKAFMAVVRDVTERKRAQEALRQSEAKYRGLLDACPDAVVMTDLSGTILFASRQVWSLIGLSDSEDLVGRSVFDYVIEDDRRRLAENIPRLAETGVRRNTEYTALCQDGTTTPTEISSAMSRDAQGQPIAVMAVIRDITDRKRAEEALQQSRDELQIIYDQIMDGIIIVDAKTERAIHVNPACCRMLGYSEEEMKTLSPERLNPSDVHPVAWKHVDTVKQGMVARSENVPFLRKGGGVTYGDVVSSLIHYNNRLCWISFFHDVTERRRAEEQLQKQHRTLKYLLQSSDHERQLIAYDIHDGLAQQLAGAIMQFQTYFHQKETNPKLAVKAYDAAMTMLQQSHFETRRLIAGVRPPILDESGIVAAVGHLVNEQSRLKGPKIEYRSSVDFDRLAPTLENSIYRIAQEGLANACHHSKSEKVKVSLSQQKDRVHIDIRDWGIGFDTKVVKENHFGLVGIRQRARLLGGKCSIRSKVGKGTRIIVELPVVERE